MYLENTENVWERSGGGLDWRHQHKHMVSRSIRQELQVIWSVFVMGGDIESHETVQEYFTGFVVGEQGVSVDMITEEAAQYTTAVLVSAIVY